VAPSFDAFWALGFLEVGNLDSDLVLFKQFRADPEQFPLGTPSGRIEIFSSTIDGFGYEDCPGHPSWLEPAEWLRAPLDPSDPDTVCVHGNPNVLTFDRGTSKLAQACSGQHALVDVERWTGALPPIRAYDPPGLDPRPGL
jgi:anaerobic selenocysteine-containing dehydrogenase